MLWNVFQQHARNEKPSKQTQGDNAFAIEKSRSVSSVLRILCWISERFIISSNNMFTWPELVLILYFHVCRWQQSAESDSLSAGEAEEEAILGALLPCVWLTLQYSPVFISDQLVLHSSPLCLWNCFANVTCLWTVSKLLNQLLDDRIPLTQSPAYWIPKLNQLSNLSYPEVHLFCAVNPFDCIKKQVNEVK